MREAVGRVADALTAAGADVQRHSPLLPDLTEAATIYIELLTSFVAANHPPQLYADLQNSAAGLGPDQRGYDTAWLRGSVLSHRDWVAADRLREMHRDQWRRLFTHFDAVLCPITPTPAFPHDHTTSLEDRTIDIDGTAYPFGDQLTWPGLATMPGLPATAIPAGQTPEGLPVGVQLIGPMYEDRTTLRLAELLEVQIGGFRPPGP